MSSTCLNLQPPKIMKQTLKKSRIMKGVLKLLLITCCDVKLARNPADEDMLQIGNKSS